MSQPRSFGVCDVDIQLGAVHYRHGAGCQPPCAPAALDLQRNERRAQRRRGTAGLGARFPAHHQCGFALPEERLARPARAPTRSPASAGPGHGSGTRSLILWSWLLPLSWAPSHGLFAIGGSTAPGTAHFLLWPGHRPLPHWKTRHRRDRASPCGPDQALSPSSPLLYLSGWRHLRAAPARPPPRSHPCCWARASAWAFCEHGILSGPVRLWVPRRTGIYFRFSSSASPGAYRSGDRALPCSLVGLFRAFPVHNGTLTTLFAAIGVVMMLFSTIQAVTAPPPARDPAGVRVRVFCTPDLP